MRRIALALALLALAPTAASAETAAPACTKSAHVCTYTLPFLADTYRVDLPGGIDTITVMARGGSSGSGYQIGGPLFSGAQGATVRATLTRIGGQTLFAYTGGRGSTAAEPAGWEGPSEGGYHGGGWGYGSGLWHFASGGGGGSSDVRLGTDSDARRIIVAGGAGGAGGGDPLFTPGYPWGVAATCWEPVSHDTCLFRDDIAAGANGARADSGATGGGGGGYQGGTANPETANRPYPGAGGTSWVDPARLVAGTADFTEGIGGDASPTLVDGMVVISYSLTPESPTGVRAVATGTTSLRATWNAPDHTGGLPLTYTATAAGGASCTTTSTTCQITGLSPAAAYMVTVRAANDDSRSDPSDTATAMTNSSVVETPLTPATMAMMAAMPTDITSARGKPISRARLLKAAGLKAPMGARVAYRIAGAKGGLKAKGAGLYGAVAGTYLVTITVMPQKGARTAKAIEIAIS